VAEGGTVQAIAKVDLIPSSSFTFCNLLSWLDLVFLALGDFSLKVKHRKKALKDVLECHW